MGKSIRALMLEDSPSDAELILHELKQSGFDPVWVRVDTPEQFHQELTHNPDIILADYSLPQYDVLQAMDAVHTSGFDVPVIVVTGAVDESRVVECLQHGASDYLVKDRLGRLGGAVSRALEYRDMQRGQRQAQRQLDEVTHLMQTVNELAPDGILVLDLDWIIQHANPQAEKLFGYCHGELVGKPGKILIPEPERARFAANPSSGQAPEQDEILGLCKDGSTLPIEYRISQQPSAAGATVVILRDVTQRKQAESQLHLQSDLLAQVSDAIYSTDLVYRITSWNHGAEYTYGWAQADTLGKTIRELIPCLNNDLVAEAFLRMKEQRFWAGKLDRKCKNGSIIQVLSSITALMDEAGRPSGYVFVDHNISDQLKYNLISARYQLLSDQARDIVLFLRFPDGLILEANQAAVEAYGYSREELLERSVYDLRPENTWDILSAQMDKANRTGALFETVHKRKGGGLIPVEVSAHGANLENGRVVISLIREITQRKETEESLRAANEQINTILNSAPLAIVTIDQKGMVTTWTPAAEKMFGWSAQEVLGKPYPLIPGGQRAEFEEHQRRSLAGESMVFLDVSRQRKDGSKIDVSVRSTPLHDASERAIGSLLILEDNTDRRTHERERETIARVASALRTADRPAEMFPVILEQVELLLGIHAAAIGLYMPEADRFRVELARGEWSQLTGTVATPTNSAVWTALREGKPTALEGLDLSIDPLLDPAGSVQSLLAVPLIARNDVIGALWAGKNGSFQEQDLALLRAIADISANAIHRARLYDQTGLAYQRLSILRTIDQAISASMDLRLVLDLLIDQITTQVRMDVAMIYLYSPSVQSLEFAAGRGYPAGDFVKSSFRLGESHIGMVALRREMEYIPDLSEAPEDDFTRRVKSIDAGLVTFIAIPLIAKGQIKGVLEIFNHNRIEPDLDWLDFLRALGAQTAIAIDNAELFGQLQRSNTNLTLAYDATIEGWSRALDLRDEETENHSQRVTSLTLKLAQRFGIPPSEQVHIRRGALLHDIGKVGVPDTILRKPGPLTEDEWAVMHKHPEYAIELLSPISYLQPAVIIPAHHHERWDGSGYPRGIKGEEIPLAARIFAVVDVWDALISDRCYRKAWNYQMALDFIRNESGKSFDPRVVEAFLKIIQEEEFPEAALDEELTEISQDSQI